jgi:hypothetical protein
MIDMNQAYDGAAQSWAKNGAPRRSKFVRGFARVGRLELTAMFSGHLRRK